MITNPGGTPENLKNFKKGQSGNPKGRPPGKPLTTILQKLLDKKMIAKNPFTGKREKQDVKTLLNLSLLAEALNGKNKTKALDMIYDRMDGKVATDINLTTKDIAAMSDEELEDIARGSN